MNHAQPAKNPGKRLTWFLLVLTLSVSFSCLAGSIAQASDPPPQPLPGNAPNVLFILVDDLRWDCVGYAGNQVVQTPNLDRLASRGVRYDRFYITSPLCSPSRATILSGLYAHQANNGILSNTGWVDIGSQTPTIANLLNDAGYRTAFIGKAHLGGDPRSWGFQETPVWLPNGSSDYDDPHLQVDGRWRTLEGNITHVFTTYAIRYLRKRGNGNRPWFLTLSTTAPHGPYCCEDRYPYDLKEIQNSPPPGLPAGTPMDDFPWTSYYAAITDMDAQIGILLDELRNLGLDRNTVVFFLSDNGVMSGSHGYTHLKGFWYEESLRVPALLAGPGIPHGRVVNHPVMNLDILPTFLDLVGSPSPENSPGKSLLIPAFSGEPIHPTVFAEGRTNNLSVPRWEMVHSFQGETAGYKYVLETETGIEHLYNTEEDPSELNDLILSGEVPPTVLSQLKVLRNQWLSSTP